MQFLARAIDVVERFVQRLIDLNVTGLQAVG
jgi:hypothetical protein